MLIRQCPSFRRTVAPRAGVLIDGAQYFGALRQAALAAEHSLFIAGWDVDTRTELRGDAEPDDGYPTTLLAFLNALLEAKPALHVSILAWDFSVIYALEREMFPSFTFGTRGHERLHYVLDGNHPTGASHHQKLVIVDERIAFLGGLDLTIRRWDTQAHRRDDARRVDPSSEPYDPFHDLQLFVEGEPARALGELFRMRWQRATGKELPPPLAFVARGPGVASDVAFRDAEVAIVRTVPPDDDGQGAITEVLDLSLAAIARAERLIYVENQYLTSAAIGDALGARLEEENGPVVLLVLPKVQSGWLERNSMGVLRARLLERLRARDRHGRLHAYCPVVEGSCITVHSKLLVIDDAFMKLGSSNLSNRSMGLDTECDAAIECPDGAPTDHPTRCSIRELVARLLAEHLGIDVAEVRAAKHEPEALLSLIERHGHGPRHLSPMEPSDDATGLGGLEDAVADPERPIEVSELLGQLLPDARPAQKPPLLRALLSIVGGVLLAPVASALSEALAWPVR